MGRVLGDVSAVLALAVLAAIPVIVVVYCSDVSLLRLVGGSCLATSIFVWAGWIRERRPLSELLSVKVSGVVFVIGVMACVRGVGWGSFREIDLGEAVLIRESWPILILLGAVLVPGHKVSLRELAGVVICMIGWWVGTGGQGFGLWHGLVFMSSFVWALHIGFVRRSGVSGEAEAFFAGLILGGVCFALSASLQPLSATTITEWFGIVLTAIALLAGVKLWRVGEARSEPVFLGSIVYTMVGLSVVLCVATGLVGLSSALVAGTVLAVLGGFICSMGSETEIG